VIKVKICGLTDERSIDAANQLKLDFVGFVHFPASPRHLPLMRAAALKSQLDRTIRSVCVLVRPDMALIDEVMATIAPDDIQLHGTQPGADGAAIKQRYPDLGIINALAIASADDVAKAMHVSAGADMLLFDAKPPAASLLPGGNGLSFDWVLLQHREFALPWMLSGGLNEANVKEAIRLSGAAMVDVSSGVERAPGVKDPALMEAFVKAARES
jgi:phosphoribosylanthranilate isomerase